MPSLLPAAVEKSFRDNKKKKNNNNNSSHQQHQDGSIGHVEQLGSRPHFLNAMALVQIPAWLLSNEGVQVIRVAANGRTEAEQLRISRDKFTVILSSPSNNNTSSRRLFSGSLFGRSNSNSSNNSTSSNNSVVVVVDIGEMDRVQRGQSTQQFEKAKNRQSLLLLNRFDSNRSIKNLNNKNSDLSVASESAADDTRSLASFSVTSAMSEAQLQQHRLDPERSFSIIFRGAHTLDLMATSLQTRNDICDALDHILDAYQGAKERVASDVRLLRFVWLNVVASANSSNGSVGNSNNNTSGTGGDNGGTDFVNVNQIARVFSQINFFMKPKDVQANYEKFGKVIGLDRSKRRRGLTFGQLADFLHYIRRNSWLVKPVTSIWNGLFGELMNNGKKRETVSDQTFLKRFLHKKQGQEDATLEQVRELFAALHDMEISHNNNRKTGSDSQLQLHDGQSPRASNNKHPGGASTDPRRDFTRINKDQFEAYLLANENDAFDPDREKLDLAVMDKPLSEYFINSSHNTYLIGDQYTSHSRVEMYSNALYRGCRCLELDIWDGGKSTDGRFTPIPVVWHGHTMTSKILFKDIIRTIKVFLNFHPDSFPIVLSFENHCTIPYQQVMARQLVDILGDSLYVPTDASLQGPLPSPAQLRGRVVIKGRRPSHPSSGERSKTSASSAASAALASGDDITEDDTFHNSGVTSLSMAETEDFDESEEEEEDEEDGEDDGDSEFDVVGQFASASVDETDPRQPGNATAESKGQGSRVNSPDKLNQPQKRTRQRSERRKKTNQHHGVAPELARLTTLHGTKFKSWQESNKAPMYHMHSFSESKVRNKLRRGYNKQDWIIYNQTHMSRSYPAGARVDSSNYNPLQAWSSGCQLVALNFQTEDAYLRLNDGRFRENGNCGYVLKPSSLMILSGANRQHAAPIEEAEDDDAAEEHDDQEPPYSEPPSSKESTGSDEIPNVQTLRLEENASVLGPDDALNPQSSALGSSEDDTVLAGTNTNSDNKSGTEDLVEVEDDDEHGIEVPVNCLLSSLPSTRLAIQVLSGSCLPKPKGQRNGDCIDPYVKLSVFDVTEEGKETVTEYSTSVVRLNGFFPVWGQEKHIFIIENAAVAMLQLTVFDKNTSKVTSKADEFIASSCIPISCLRKGIRSVKLYDATNTRSGAFDFASLLLDIDIRQVTAEI